MSQLAPKGWLPQITADQSEQQKKIAVACSHSKTFFISSLGNKMYYLFLDALSIFGKLEGRMKGNKSVRNFVFHGTVFFGNQEVVAY